MLKTYIKMIGSKLLSKDHQLRIRKWLSARRLKAGDYKKEPEISILRHFVCSGSLALDIGANLGYYTCELARLVGHDGRVIAFEPIPEAYERLEYSVRKLGFENTTIYKTALSDMEGHFSMTVPLDEHGREILGLSHLTKDGNSRDAKTYTVQTDRLDDMNLDLANLSFIKCDVEGAELKVLIGAEQTLVKHEPVILLEIEGRHLQRYNLTPTDVFSFLHNLGYQPFYFNGHNMVECKDIDEGYNNYIFIPHKSLSVINAIG